MADHMLNMVAIRYFQEVARAGSFRRAADRINVAASAINRHVRILEEELGVRLLDRGRGRSGVTLTAAGEVLIRRVGYALNELQAARDEIASLQGRQKNQVRIGMTDALAKDLAQNMIRKFHEEAPNASFEIIIETPPRLIDLLMEDRLDAVIVYDVAPQIGLQFVAEYAFASCAVVHKDHPFASRKSVSLAECAAYPLAMPAETGYQRDLLSRMASDIGITPRPLITTNSYELMRDLVAAKLAISFQSNLPMHVRIGHPDIVFVPLNEPLARYSQLSLSVRKGRKLSFSAQLFLRSAEGYLESQYSEFRLRAF